MKQLIKIGIQTIRTFICLFFFYTLLISQSLALTDEEKMKAVEEMFDSPYTEEMYYRTDRLLLTATGSLQPVYRAPAVATVITADDIKKTGAVTLDQALEVVPGLHVGISPLNRLDPIFSIRGIHTGLNSQVLLLINNLPITKTFNGSRPNTFRLPVENIARIEVVRGPGSAIYGADAFAGVINVITKDNHDIDGVNVGGRLGSFGFHDGWLQYGSTLSGWDVALSVEHMNSDGDTDRIINSDQQTILDTIFGTNASLAPGPLETDFRILDASMMLRKDKWTCRLWGWTQEDAGLGASVATQALDPVGNQNVDQFQADISYNNSDLVKNWEFDARLSYYYLKDKSFLQLFPPGTILPIGADGNINFSSPAGTVLFTDGLIGAPTLIDDQIATELTAIFSGFNQHEVRFGTGFKYFEEDTEETKNFGPGVIDGTISPIDGTLTDVSNTPFVFMEKQIRRLVYLSLQDEWAFAKNWELTAGIRYDHYSDFGDTVNPRVALVWETLPELTTKLLYGEGFRPPSFSELFAINNPATIGNPNLEPETIKTVELAFDYQPTAKFRTILNLFHYKIDDLIEFVQDTGATTKTAQNNKDQKGQGFEVEADWKITEDLRLYGNFAYQRSKNDDTGEIVADAPALQLYINPHWDFRTDWSLDGQLFWIGDRERASGDTRPDIKNNALINLTIRRQNIFDHLEAAVSVRNLFDENAREPATSVIPNDYPLDGRSIYGEIRFTY